MADKANTAHTDQASQSTGTILFAGPKDIALPRLVLILAVFLLTVIGLVMVFSSSTIEAINEGSQATSYLTRQLVVAVVGIAFAGMLAAIPYYHWLGPVFWGFYAVVIVLLLLTAAIGTAELGAQRWLTIGPISFQPSELAKPALVMLAARITYKGRIEGTYDFTKMTLMIVLGVIVPLAFLYVTQSDLGTTVICLVGIIVVAWLSDVPVRVFVAVFIGIAVFVGFAILGSGYRSDRLNYLNPQDDYYGAGYQLMRSFYAFAEGGLFGVGLGNSTEKYLYLPEAETDFIFAIIGEELGLIGAIVVILLFLVLLWAGLQIARNAPDLFGTMLAGSCTVMLVFQAFLNIACVIGALPTTGKPLPFISAGGSSLLGSFMLIGLILAVSFASGADSGVYGQRRDDLVLVRSGAGRAQYTSSSRKNRTSRSKSTASRAQSSTNARMRSTTSARAAARNRRGKK